MDKEKVTKWLNRLVRATKQLVNIRDYEPGTLEVCGQPIHRTGRPYVHLYRGLHEVAELLGLEVRIDYETDENICYAFLYNGIDFIQLGDKEQKED